MTRRNKRILLSMLALTLVGGLVIGGAVAAAYATRDSGQNASLAAALNALQDDDDDVQPEPSLSNNERGVLITHVAEDSPAAAAGLERGNIVLSVDGQEVNTPRELHQAIKAHEAGDTIALTVQNGDATEELSVTLASAGPYLGLGIGEPGGCAALPGNLERFMGPGGLAERFDFRGGRPFGHGGDFFAEGAEVTITVAEVLPDTPAAAAGLQAGDVITAVDGTPVGAPGQSHRLLREKQAGDNVSLTIQRGQETLELTATLAANPDNADRPYLGVQLTIEVARTISPSTAPDSEA